MSAYLVVGRFLKPHGLKGEAVVLPLTDDPEIAFAVGRALCPVGDDGTRVGNELIVARSRPFQRRWLLAFEGIDHRAQLERWRQQYLGAKEDELRPPEADEMYLHEIAGATVVENGVEIGTAQEVIGAPGNQLLLVTCDGREHMIPFCAPIVRRLDRQRRQIEVQLPPGLLEI